MVGCELWGVGLLGWCVIVRLDMWVVLGCVVWSDGCGDFGFLVCGWMGEGVVGLLLL